MTNQHTPRTPAGVEAAANADLVHSAARKAELSARNCATPSEAKRVFWSMLRELLKGVW